MDKNELNKALEIAKEAEKISRKAKDETKQFQACKQMGQIYERLWNPKKALECFKRAVKIGDKIGHPETALITKEIEWVLEKEIDEEPKGKKQK